MSKTTERIKFADSKVLALCRIAEAQAEAGLVDDARKTFASALKTAECIEDIEDKAHALRDIAEAQAQAGLVDDALKTVEQIDDAFYKASALSYRAMPEFG